MSDPEDPFARLARESQELVASLLAESEELESDIVQTREALARRRQEYDARVDAAVRALIEGVTARDAAR